MDYGRQVGFVVKLPACTLLAVLSLVAGSTGVAGAAAAGNGDSTTDVFCKPGTNGVQAAVDAAGSGDTIRVHGLCVGDISVPGAGGATSLTLLGVGKGVIQGSGVGATLTVENGVAVTVRGLGITGGNNGVGAGGIEVDSATLVLSGSAVYGNRGCLGGGIALVAAEATIVGSTIRDNVASCPDIGSGGGIEVFGLAGQSTLTMTGSTVSRNSAPEGVGGGIDVVLARASVSNSTVSGNSTFFSGGGINSQFDSSLEVQNTVFRDNLAYGTGGGLENDEAHATVTDSLFESNSSPGFDSDSGVGGAIDSRSDFDDDSLLELADTIVRSNTANYGAGLSNLGEFGHRATVMASHLILTVNDARTSFGRGRGGGVFNQDEGGGAVLTFVGASVTENQADLGGGFYNNARGGLALTALAGGTIVSRNRAFTDGGGIFNVDGGNIALPGALLFLNSPNDCSGC